MEEMTYGDHGPQYPSGYPYAPPPPGGYPPYPPGLYPPAPYGYPQPPAPAPGRSQSLAILSIVFAFIFAPLGAVFGHLALGQIKRGLQRGRDLALIGLTLSYAFIVLTAAALAVWIVTDANSRDTTVATSPDAVVPDPAHPETPSAPGVSGDVSGVLLGVDELKSILGAPGLTATDSNKDDSEGSTDAKAEPAECATAVAAGLNTVYDHSGATDYIRAGYSDPATSTLVDEVAAAFPTAADAREFVAQNAEVWKGCAGKTFTLSSSDSPALTWDLGTPATSGTRVTLHNTLTARQGLPQHRILAARGNIVIDISVLAKQLDDESATIADRMLARIPG